jgi:hypothetical protein
VAGIEESDKCFETFVNSSIVKLVSSSNTRLNCK